MKLAVCKEQSPETRVACTPSEAARVMELGYAVLVAANAGRVAGFDDRAYRDVGARIIESDDELWREAQVICKVARPSDDEAARVRSGQTVICFFAPAQHGKPLAQLAAQDATVLAMDAVPRISRAQKFDALSAMANVAGYRAVIDAAQHFGRFFAGQTTAAGHIEPAKVLVIGAGVAGLSAIGAAVNLGAIVRAFDTRLEVKEQIESMRAEFLQLDFTESGEGAGGYGKTMSAEFIAAEMALFAEQAREVDIIITTAQIPGKPAPKLISAKMVESMRAGSVVVDLAAAQGGNCEATEPGGVIVHHGVHIVGHLDYAARMAMQASELYAANIRHLLDELTPQRDGQLTIDFADEVIRAMTIAHRGEVTWSPPQVAVRTEVARQPAAENAATTSSGGDQPSQPSTTQPSTRWRGVATLFAALLGGAAILAVGAVAPESFLNHFIVFVLACFVGWQVIWNVSPALHTPLMSVTNAISSIIVIGALVQTDSAWRWLALCAVLLAAINIFGGFGVTWRMLKMFRK